MLRPANKSVTIASDVLEALGVLGPAAAADLDNRVDCVAAFQFELGALLDIDVDCVISTFHFSHDPKQQNRYFK